MPNKDWLLVDTCTDDHQFNMKCGEGPRLRAGRPVYQEKQLKKFVTDTTRKDGCDPVNFADQLRLLGGEDYSSKSGQSRCGTPPGSATRDDISFYREYGMSTSFPYVPELDADGAIFESN